MNHPDLAIRFAEPPANTRTQIHIAHPYRQTWWLPQLGPTSTCLLNHLSTNITISWTVHHVDELSCAMGLKPRNDPKSQLNRTLSRIVYHHFGHFDIAPGDPTSPPCITLYNHIPVVPERISRRWPQLLQRQHDQALQTIIKPQAA